MGGIHDASRAAANTSPSARDDKQKAAMNMGDLGTRNADFAARQREKIYGPSKG